MVVAKDTTRLKKIMEHERVFEFLVGLNPELDRVQILGNEPFPSIQEVYAYVIGEESPRVVMLGGYTPENSALATAGNLKSMGSKVEGRTPDDKDSLWCNYCHKPRHTRESCRKPHGKPQLGSKGGSNRGGKPVTRSGQAHQAATIDISHENIPTTEQELILISKEHYEKLKMLLNQLDTRAEIPTAKITSSSFVQTGNIEALSASKDCLSSIWIIDSRDTNHITSHSNFFSNYTTLSSRPKVKVANSTFSSIIGQGIASITPSLTLQNVLHVPNLSCNLLSVCKITKDLNCFVTFTPSYCVFQDR